MAFRDEHEAALQRARSLERELKRTRAARDRAEKKLLEVVIERDALAREVAESQRRLADAGLAARQAGQVRGSGGALGLVAVMAVAVLGLGLCRSRTAPAPNPPPIAMPSPPERLAQCEIASDPPGVEIVSQRGQQLLGLTPTSIAHIDWMAGEGLELRREGYQPVRLEIPTDANDCARQVTLRRVAR